MQPSTRFTALGAENQGLDGAAGVTTTSRGGRPPESSRERVQATAIDLFLDRGYAETSIADIAAAGIGKTTFFRYYPGASCSDVKPEIRFRFPRLCESL
ncbi:TetR family transcriptional regulator [Rhodococcus sp. 14C212]|nr:TetR family transcriptional regulator [Rhodococcus sp. 14C212]